MNGFVRTYIINIYMNMSTKSQSYMASPIFSSNGMPIWYSYDIWTRDIIKCGNKIDYMCRI